MGGCGCVWLCVCVYLCVCMCVCMCVCVDVCVWMCVCVDVCVYAGVSLWSVCVCVTVCVSRPWLEGSRPGSRPVSHATVSGMVQKYLPPYCSGS